jgi:hypothetical protein
VPTRVNSLTASTPSAIRTPIHFPTDRACLEAIAPTVGKFDAREVTIGWIRNTLELSDLALSENLRPAIERNPTLEIVSTARAIEFDSAGNLVLLPRDSVQPRNHSLTAYPVGPVPS